jgi:opacity protein-like surface antigen
MMREIRTLFRGAILLIGTLAFAPVLSQADEIPSSEDNPYARNGFYIGLAGAFAFDAAAEEELEKQSKEIPDNPGGLKLRIGEDIGLQARLGYRFHPRFAAEYQFEWITDVDIDVQGVPFGKGAFQLERWASTANVKAYLATDTVQPFLLVGLGVLTVEVDGSPVEVDTALGIFQQLSVKETDFAARFGAGFEVYATEHIIINLGASYVLPAGNLEHFDYVSVEWGFLYRF